VRRNRRCQVQSRWIPLKGCYQRLSARPQDAGHQRAYEESVSSPLPRSNSLFQDEILVPPLIRGWGTRKSWLLRNLVRRTFDVHVDTSKAQLIIVPRTQEGERRHDTVSFFNICYFKPRPESALTGLVTKVVPTASSACHP